ncbi:SDR family oxidoreductase [Actinomadura barringtoniae]|uniref:SDR family oxidoreductase n=1 Tax=Actinomadura barringtoniae TaxID=1427535 RepID=A0A939PMQ2_9ACTN|nr:SDR family oxidoreductase [Actinomadura barringtoniae]MBO2452729.1 SDR family oxidoreductase [Actinomadura barringtoniae]
MSTRTVLITGAAGGIGSATARRLTEMGWEVYGGVRRASDTDRLPAGVHPLVLDVTDEETIAAAAKDVEARTGSRGLDALVNNAGVIVQGPAELVPMEAWRRQFDINLFGLVAVTQAVLPMLRAGGGGRIVNVGAISARVTAPTLGPIAASKAAVASLSETLRMELRTFGVQVSLVEPGALQTEIFDKAGDAARAAGLRGTAADQRLYGPMTAAVEKATANMKPGPVDAAVKRIVDALTARRAATRTLAGRDARMFAVLTKLPDRTRDRLVSRALGV